MWRWATASSKVMIRTRESLSYRGERQEILTTEDTEDTEKRRRSKERPTSAKTRQMWGTESGKDYAALASRLMRSAKSLSFWSVCFSSSRVCCKSCAQDWSPSSDA